MFIIPEGFKERYSQIVDEPEAFFSSLEKLTPKSFRVNSLKSSADEVRMRLESYGMVVHEMPWYEDAFVSENPEVGSTLEHFLGWIYVQELVSMLPPVLLRKELETASGGTHDASPANASFARSWVLDGCAAPGSKTTQMAAMMQNRGTIVANDLDYSRIRALKFNLEKVGALNTMITNRNLMDFPQNQFDVVILDAPCTAEGTMRKSGARFNNWSPTEIPKYSRIQKAMILKSFDLLRPGGSMVYSTCTFAPEENEEVLDWLLQNRQDAKLEDIKVEGMKLSEGITEWEKKAYDPRVKLARRVWPHHNDTGGFFMARVTK